MVKKIKKRYVVIGILIVAIFAGMLGLHHYFKDYYHATTTAEYAIAGDDQIRVTSDVIETKTHKTRFYIMSPKDESIEKKGGIIFYPGGKVEESAYAPMLREIALEGYDVYILKMPLYLAIFGMNKADDIIEKYSDTTNWMMMGHSLGGAMAANYTAKNTDRISGLILLAAYSTKDLSDSDVRVFQVYGSEDQVLNRENLKKYASNLPADALICEIEGGNHAYYAYYGEQEGDGTATITREEQIQGLMDELLLWGL